MRNLLSLWTAGLAVSPVLIVTAFYPYQPQWGDGSSATSRRGLHLLPSQSDHAERPQSITLPLRRVPVRRDNKYRIIKSKEPQQENSVAIHQDGNDEGIGNDLSYMVAVTFGDSKEEYHLLLDSATSKTWVMGSSCQTDACGTHNLFGRADSSNLEISPEPFNITYGTGTVRGVIASDSIHIGPLSADLEFGLADHVTDEFRAFPMDGILGIGRGTEAEGTIDTLQVLEVFKNTNLIDTKLYGVHLARGRDGLNDGELNFGAPNKDRYDGDLNNVPLIDNDNGFWEIKVDSIGVGGATLDIRGKTAVMDTGTAYIYMPEGDAVTLHEKIQGSDQSGETFSVPCDTDEVIWIEFGGSKYNISIADWKGGRLESGLCKSNIVGRRTFEEWQWLVGDVFLKNVYTVFDVENEQIGFGVKSEGEASKPTPSEEASTTPTKSSTSDPEASATEAPEDSLAPEAQDATGSGEGLESSSSPTGSASHTTASPLSPILYLLVGLLSSYVY